jgi:hypothetical protein
VVETGSSIMSDSGEEREVSYGVVLENASSTYLAIQTRVMVRLTDADGNQVRDRIEDPPGDPSWEIQTIFPGQRMGFGDDTYIDGNPVEELTVEVGQSLWMPIDQIRDVAAVTATDITFDRTEPGLGAEITFMVAGGYALENSALSSGAIRWAESHAIFRDADGNIVGGAGRAGNRHEPGNPRIGHVGVSSIPDRAVTDATEIYVSLLYGGYIDPLC